MPIRAKFRCLDLNLRWDFTSSVKLAPVTRRKYGPGEPLNFKENEQFWKYTPSGECYLHFQTNDPATIPFKLGSYYYIDMEPAADGEWGFDSAMHYGSDGSGEVTFSHQPKPGTDGLRGGYVKLGLSGESAKVTTFGPTGAKWNVTFSLAHDHTIES